jgi:hypothetical protein
MVAEYVPAAVPPGTATLMVGFQVAELSPVMPVAVTTGATPARLAGLLAVYVAVPTLVIVPRCSPRLRRRWLGQQQV